MRIIVAFMLVCVLAPASSLANSVHPPQNNIWLSRSGHGIFSESGNSLFPHGQGMTVFNRDAFNRNRDFGNFISDQTGSHATEHDSGRHGRTHNLDETWQDLLRDHGRGSFEDWSLPNRHGYHGGFRHHGWGDWPNTGCEPPAAVPVPAALWLFISGILGLSTLINKRKR